MAHTSVTYRALSTKRLQATQGFSSLLTPDGYSPKLNKGRARGYSSAVLHLAPGRLSGFNVCSRASAGCLAGCLNVSGHGAILKPGEVTPVVGISQDIERYNEVQRARIRRTRWFFEDRPAFLAQLAGEIETHIRRARANGMTPVVRLNGTSDIPWERVKLNGRSVFEMFPEIQFYDYSKIVERALAYANGQMPANYHVTFSRSESNGQEVARVLAAGGNVAVVFKTAALPSSWHGVAVANGDQDDLRFLDPAGCVVGLKAKGKAKKDTSGFVVDPAARISIALPMLTVAA